MEPCVFFVERRSSENHGVYGVQKMDGAIPENVTQLPGGVFCFLYCVYSVFFCIYIFKKNIHIHIHIHIPPTSPPHGAVCVFVERRSSEKHGVHEVQKMDGVIPEM